MRNCKPAAKPAVKPPFRVTRRLFAWAVLHEAGLPRNPAQMRCLVAVMVGENSQAHWNPMDTTRNEAGVTPYNSFGPGGSLHVWDYPTAEAGVAATAATMLQANMAAWVDTLRKPDVTAEQCAEAFERVEWAFRGDTVPLQIVQAWADGRRSYVRDRAAQVPGPGGWTFPKVIR